MLKGLALTHLEEAELLARTLNDRARLGRVLVEIVQRRRTTAHYAGALAAGQGALAIGAALGDTALQVAAAHRLGQVYYERGDFRQAATLLRRNVEALASGVAEAGGPDASLVYGIQSRAWLAPVLGTLGEFAAGLCYGTEALCLATVAHTQPTVVHGCLSLLYLTKGDLEHAIQMLEQSLAFCRATDNRNWGRWIAAGLGHAYALTGRLTAGRALLEEALRDDSRTGARNAYAERVARLSVVELLAGHRDEALQHARQAQALARQYQERGYEAFALAQLGAVLASADPPAVAPAATHYRQALTLAEALGMRPLQAHCHRGLGMLYATVGQQEQACAALSTAISMYQAMEMTFWLPQTEAALAQVNAR